MTRQTGNGNRLTASILAVVASTLLLASCGARVVRDQSPFVQINGLMLEPAAVVLDLGVRNVNDVPMELLHVDFRLSLRDTELATIDEPRSGSIIANGTESLEFRFPANAAGRDLLTGLQNGDMQSLPYRLEGSILSAEDHRFPFEGGGHLYPVPGRPGRFR